MNLLNRTLRLITEKPLYGGFFLGRHMGKAVMVPFTEPGETITVRISEEKKDHCFAMIDEIITEAGNRIQPPCPLFCTCGGCAYLHLGYQTELSMKKIIVEDALTRTGGIPFKEQPEIALYHSERFGYRSHASLKARNGIFGFFRRGSNDLVSIRECGCLLLADALNRWLVDSGPKNTDFRAAIDANGRIITSSENRGVVEEKALGLTFMRGIGQFFQANRLLREKMIEIVKEYADGNHSDTFLDIACGVGFFTLPLAAQSAKCTGIDISDESIEWAKRNAKKNGIPNVEFQTMQSAKIHPTRSTRDAVIIDPPRAGIDKKTRHTIIAMKPRRIVYVSCNPSTFARDTKDFLAGGYRLERLALIDMFPGTHHIEVISRFVSS